jgi:hypothetical protein
VEILQDHHADDGDQRLLLEKLAAYIKDRFTLRIQLVDATV